MTLGCRHGSHKTQGRALGLAGILGAPHLRRHFRQTSWAGPSPQSLGVLVCPQHCVLEAECSEHPVGPLQGAGSPRRSFRWDRPCFPSFGDEHTVGPTTPSGLPPRVASPQHLGRSSLTPAECCAHEFGGTIPRPTVGSRTHGASTGVRGPEPRAFPWAAGRKTL